MSNYIAPIAYAATGTTAGIPVVPGAKKAMTVIVLSTGLMVTSTSSALAAMPEDILQRRANASTNSGTILEQAASQRSFAEALAELRRRSGLTWEVLASLFNVDRRSVHMWASGRPLNAANAERLNRLLGVVRRVDRGSSSATKAWLLAPTPSGKLPLDLLREGRFDEVPSPSAILAARPGPAAHTARTARAPLPPEQLVDARTERVHTEKTKLIKASRLKFSKSK